MPAISAPSTVLVTGANGYIAAHVLKVLLDHGFSARGTVRSSAKGDSLKQLFAEHGDRFQYMVVPDVNAPGAYDQAVVGVTGIAHLNAPPIQMAASIEEILKPSVQGTTALLESAQKFGKDVKRFVLTSSIVAVNEPKQGVYHYTEADWNETAVAEVEAKGLEAGTFNMYFASKVLQERAALDFMEKHKSTLAFDLVSVAPGWVLGPMLGEQAKPGPNSVSMFLSEVTGNISGYPLSQFVDVRDLAEIHVRSLKVEAAAKQRFIAVRGPYSWQEALDALNALDPKPVGVAVGVPGSTRGTIPEQTYDNSKSRDVLDFEYRDAAESMRDIWADFVQRGWVDKA